MSFLYPLKGEQFIPLVYDLVIILVSYGLALVLPEYPNFNSVWVSPSWNPLPLITLVYLLNFYSFRVYRIMWEYSGVRDVLRLITANLTGFLISILLVTALNMRMSHVNGMLFFLLVCLLTLLIRTAVKSSYIKKIYAGTGKSDSGLENLKGISEEQRILIAGAGEAGRMILAEYARKDMDKCIVGFIDDDERKIGQFLGGKPVFGPTGRVKEIIRENVVSEVIIAMPSADVGIHNRIILAVTESFPSLPVKLLPSFTRVFEKSLSPDLKELGIEDLLGREEFDVDVKAIQKHFSGKTVLITGAGGSIGSEICRQLVKFDLRRLIALGKGEFSIYTLAKELNDMMYYLDSNTPISYHVADVKDHPMIDSIFSKYRPDIVFHAAAHKHVPLLEFNEIEAIQNNVLGSRNVFESAGDNGAEECILVSTDKAVNPCNIMGATKRLAEIYALYYFREKGLKTSIVRFGNVIGSRGSVLPLFIEQIKKGGPVTVTHPEVTRYFMSIPEASLLLINAAAYSAGGEIFVLDMGRPHKMEDIARRLIQFYGFEPDKDIKIKYSGLRPGEKITEELFYSREKLKQTHNNKIFILDSRNDLNIALLNKLSGESIKDLYDKGPSAVRRKLKELVPEYEFDEDSIRSDKHNRFVN